MSVSVIGLGKIGSEIVPHLLSLGEVKVWNRSQAAVDRAVELGATAAKDLSDAFASDLVISALFDDQAVLATMTSELISQAAPQTLHVCLSTLSPDLADDLARLHAVAGVGYLSAPLFGRPEAVQLQAANICVAGNAELIERARPYLETFGRLWPIGQEPRQANVAKLCGNYLIGAAVAAMAEATAILNMQGADADAFMSLMTKTLFSCPIYKNYAPSVTGTRPLPPTGLALPMKDMELLAAVAGNDTAKTGILAALREQLSRAATMGLGADDWSVALAGLARHGHAHAPNDPSN
ncbi:NAD(P)-dependent oxidoreductase [Agrobacterium vitis]|uniref:NAD(P)-dependent oxidoreductase n=2 Tax=Agrobacterium vitis TaxID=373 RepID=A0AAE2UPU0_AGRVI|nr:NAD(P)-dependent oxidoreductase [Agrobacterium vitis]MBF2714332.1 NAD(P)-dependent oxidoreductase [Agrobacterium vitis]